MVEPEKPFACTIPDCGMTFTNEDRLHVHTKKHDMALQFGLEQKSAFVADQTPTPTRFIRNCEEVGLFQDLQNVAANPFDEGFKRAMEAKQGICLEAMTPSDDVLHTPLVFPLIDGDTTLFTNNQRNITISRSSSDESGTIKEFESRTISKLTNEVTISRIVNSNQTDDITIKHTDIQKDIETVSYKNNVIKIESNVIRENVDNLKPTVSAQTDTETKGVSSEKDTQIDNNKLVVDKMPIMSQKSIDFVVDSLTSELDNNVNQTVINNNINKPSTVVFSYGKRPQIKQVKEKKNGGVNKRIYLKNILAPPRILCKPEKPEDNIKIEVVVKLPNGKQVKMRPIDENKDTKVDTKDIIRNRITKKVAQTLPIIPCKDNEIAMKNAQIMSNIVIPPGTLIPVTLVDQAGTPLSNKELTKVPIRKISNEEINNLNTVPVITKPIVRIQKLRKTKTHSKAVVNKSENTQKLIEVTKDSCRVKERHDDVELGGNEQQAERIYFTQEDIVEKLRECAQSDSADNSQDDDCFIETISRNPEVAKRTRIELESRCAASKRYRERLKEAMRRQSEENKLLRQANERLIADKAVLKLIITQHMKECSNSDDLSKRLNVLRNCDL